MYKVCEIDGFACAMSADVEKKLKMCPFVMKMYESTDYDVDLSESCKICMAAAVCAECEKDGCVGD